MAQLRRFPPEVLEQIFIYLEYEDLKQVRRACNYFNAVINNCPNLATEDVCIVNTTFKKADFSYITKLIDKSTRKKWNLHINDDDMDLKLDKSNCTYFWNTSGWKLHSISLGKIDENLDVLSSIILECVNLQELSMSIDDRKVVKIWLNKNSVATSDESYKILENRTLKFLKIEYTSFKECLYMNCLLQINFLKIFPNVTKSLMLYEYVNFDRLPARHRMVITSFLCQRPNLFFYITRKPHYHAHTSTIRLHMSQVSHLHESICIGLEHNFNNNEIEVFTCEHHDVSSEQMNKYIDHLPNLHTLIIPHYKLDDQVLKRLQISNVKTLHVDKFEDAINSENYISKSKNCLLESLYLETFQLGSMIFANLKMLYTKILSVNDFQVICNGSFPCLEKFMCYYVTGQFSEGKTFDIFISNLPSLIYLGIPNHKYLDYSANLPKLKYFVAYNDYMTKSNKNITADFFSKKFLCPQIKMISGPSSFFGIDDENPIEPQLIKFIYPLKELRVFMLPTLKNKILDIDISKIREVCPAFKLIRGLDSVWCWDAIKCESFKFDNFWWYYYENVNNGNTFWNITTSRWGVSPFYCKVTSCAHDYRSHGLLEVLDESTYERVDLIDLPLNSLDDC